MKRTASILTGLSLAVLFFAASAHAQSERRITASIPFEFTVGSISLPAGQYEFVRTEADRFQVRGADRHSVYILSSATIQANALPERSMLKFVTIDGRHILVQIWNELSQNGNKFPQERTEVKLAKYATTDGTATDRR